MPVELDALNAVVLLIFVEVVTSHSVAALDLRSELLLVLLVARMSRRLPRNQAADIISVVVDAARVGLGGELKQWERSDFADRHTLRDKLREVPRDPNL